MLEASKSIRTNIAIVPSFSRQQCKTNTLYINNIKIDVEHTTYIKRSVLSRVHIVSREGECLTTYIPCTNALHQVTPVNTHGFNLCIIMDVRIVSRWWWAWTLKILPIVMSLLLCDCPCYKRFPHKLFQAIWLARMPNQPFAQNNICLKKGKKHWLLKDKKIKVHSSIVQWQ